MRNMRVSGGAVLCALFLAAPLHAQQLQFHTQTEALPAPTGNLVIRNLDAIWTATGEVLRNSSIAVRDGIITGIGANVTVPAGAIEIDGRGLTAMPGIVDSHSHIGMGGGANEGTAPVVPEVRVIDDLDPSDWGLYQALSGGVTTAQILHGSSNPIGGQSAIIKTRWGLDHPHEMLLAGAPRTVKFALGENVTRKNANNPQDRFPASRAGVEAVIVQAFTAAQEYRDAWAAYRRNPRSMPVPPRRDLRLETLVDIMEGRIRVQAHSYRSDEILMLMRAVEQFGFKVDVFTHVLEGYRVADEMARHGAAGSTFSDWWMYKLEVFDAIPYNATIMQRHGVLTSLNSDIPWLQSSLLYEMQKPVKYGGVTKEEALRMLTINPARQIHVDRMVGSLELGKQGDVVLLDGDPFNSFTRVEKTIVDGIVYYDRTAESEKRGEPVRQLAHAPQFEPMPAAPLPPVETVGEWLPEPVSAEHKMTDPLSDVAITAIVGGTVHPVSGPAIENGVVVMQNGRITYVGSAAQAAIPAGARRVDATGRHVWPGMIDPLTSLGLVDIESVNTARDDREVGQYNPHVRSLWSVNPFSEAIPVARANGVTSVLTIPGNGVVRGTASVIQLRGDTPERMEIEADNALVIDFPALEGNDWDEPKLAGEDVLELHEVLKRARLYAEAPSSRRDPTAAWEINSAPSDRALLEGMAPAMRGEVRTIFIADDEREIRTLLMMLDSFPNIRAVIGGGAQAFHVADELARRNIPVIVGTNFTPSEYRDDPVTSPWRNAAILHANGVKVSFTTSFSPEGVSEVRNLPYAAARAVAYGMDRDEAYRSLTQTAAELLGLDSQLGTLEVGKRGDIIITNGDPLQILSHVERVFIAGQEMPVVSKHTELYRKFRARDAKGGVTTTEP